MSYKPPAARMRQIQQKLREERAAQAEKETPPEKPETKTKKAVDVDVGAMQVTVKAGADGKLGTKDDKVEIKPKPKKKIPEFDESMTKDKLLQIAKRLKVDGLTMRNTKNEILKALKNQVKSFK